MGMTTLRSVTASSLAAFPPLCFAPEDDAGNAGQQQPQYGEADDPQVALEVGDGGVAVSNGQHAFAEVTKSAADADRQAEAAGADVRHAGEQDEDLERG